MLFPDIGPFLTPNFNSHRFSMTKPAEKLDETLTTKEKNCFKKIQMSDLCAVLRVVKSFSDQMLSTNIIKTK